jgi:hypothetical protein
MTVKCNTLISSAVGLQKYEVVTSKEWKMKLKLLQYQINANRRTHILLGHRFINTICHSNMFQPLKGAFVTFK